MMFGVFGNVKLQSKLSLASCVKILKPYEEILSKLEIKTWKRFFLGRLRGEGKQKGFGIRWTSTNHFLLFSWTEAKDPMGPGLIFGTASTYRSISKYEVTVFEKDQKTFLCVQRSFMDKLSKLSVVFLFLIVLSLFLFVFNQPLVRENLVLYPLCGGIFIYLVLIVRGLIKDSKETSGALQRLLGAERIN